MSRREHTILRLGALALLALAAWLPRSHTAGRAAAAAANVGTATDTTTLTAATLTAPTLATSLESRGDFGN